jgi:hypothetical protein
MQYKREKGGITEGTSSKLKWAAIICQFYLLVYFFVFGVLAVIDYGCYFYMGAGVFYVLALSLHILGFGCWLIFSSIAAQCNGRISDNELAKYMWPRYRWDIYSWVVANFIMFITLCGVLIAYMAQIGWNADPNFLLAPTYDQTADRYQSNDLLITFFCVILFTLTIEATWAYIGDLYPIALMTQIMKIDRSFANDIGDTVILRGESIELVTRTKESTFVGYTHE